VSVVDIGTVAVTLHYSGQGGRNQTSCLPSAVVLWENQTSNFQSHDMKFHIVPSCKILSTCYKSQGRCFGPSDKWSNSKGSCFTL